VPRIARNIEVMVEKHPDMAGGAPYILKGMMK
jgi:hypothetical protein